MTTREDIEKEWCLQREKWGLSGWVLKLSHQRRHLGYCNPVRKTISVSLLYMERNPFHIMKDTLLHEIAHAIHFIETGKMGHNNGWKVVAQRVGCAPVRCASLQGSGCPRVSTAGYAALAAKQFSSTEECAGATRAARAARSATTPSTSLRSKKYELEIKKTAVNLPSFS